MKIRHQPAGLVLAVATVAPVALGAAIALLGLGCQKEESVPAAPQAMTNASPGAVDTLKKELKEAAAPAAAALTGGKEKFVESTQQTLKAMDANIDALSQKASTLTGDVKTKTDAMLGALREKRQKAAAELEKVKAASPETWTEVQNSCSAVMKELQAAYEEAKAKLG